MTSEVVPDEPLHVAAFLGLKTTFQTLLDTGVAVNTLDDWGYSALHWAAKSGEDGIVELALRRGAEVNRQNMYRWTPLMLAAMSGPLSTLQLLLNHNACADMKNSRSESALDIVVPYLWAENIQDVVRLLLDNGATLKNDPDIVYASRLARNRHAAKVLEGYGLDVEAVSNMLQR